MKFAIISDTHFGDDTSVLMTKNKSTDNIEAGDKFKEFQKAVGKQNDYLILAGDIFDFSIAPYEKAYEYGRKFFQLIKKNNIADEIIYIPGNHDGDIWHIIQHQRSVINRLIKGELPKEYQHSVAGIIDDRKKSATKGFFLNKVTVRTKAKSGSDEPKYGRMFLDFITGENDPINFNFAYPNLYIVTDNESVLVTHGQYLESYWSILGEYLNKIANDDLKVGEVDIEEMVEMNFPLNQLACTGLGQAGVLTELVRQIQLDAKNKELKRITKYLDRLRNVIDKMTDYPWYKFYKEKIEDYLLEKIQEEILNAISGIEKSRYSEEFIYKKEVKDRFFNFYNASMLELGAINETHQGINIPAPSRIIFGHTHQPISWNEKNPPKMNTVSSASPRRVTLHNTGGWLENNGSFCGAEVFTYETGKGFSSVSII
ncbi:MAG: metallophosphoesterase [Deltaproteobacteria bacterium]|nr:metallophosphoesterase [Deltaproteobacteria bacterium]